LTEERSEEDGDDQVQPAIFGREQRPMRGVVQHQRVAIEHAEEKDQRVERREPPADRPEKKERHSRRREEAALEDQWEEGQIARIVQRVPEGQQIRGQPSATSAGLAIVHRGQGESRVR
jgi:hypothetical protein